MTAGSHQCVNSSNNEFGQNKNYNHRPSNDVIMKLSKSVETIYKNAIEKCVSSSSKECIDISDETLADSDPEFDGVGDQEFVARDPVPSTSSGHRGHTD